MIVADSDEERKEALAELLPLQQEDFEGLFEEMQGLPVTIRLLDPPLHEFLPVPHELEEGSDPSAGRAEELAGDQPDAGHPRRAAGHPAPRDLARCRWRRWSGPPRPCGSGAAPRPVLEIMVPLVAYEKELAFMREVIERAVQDNDGGDLELKVGTMLELPRACFLADVIGEEADFFSFGTNDLTQTALGFSRDDAEGKFLDRYLEQKIIDRSPFETLDTPGRRAAGADGGVAGPLAQQGAGPGHLRRARGRPRVDRLLPPLGPGLRELLAVPGADRPCGGRAGRGVGDLTGCPLRRASPRT